MESQPNRTRWLRRLMIASVLIVVAAAGALFFVSRADGPVFIFAGGPIRSGERVALSDMDWEELDALHELQMEIVAEASSRTLWFSVHEGIPYVACDLDCVDGRLSRWPQQIDRDNRVVIRIEGQRAEARLVHVPHGEDEYVAVRAGRAKKYAGNEGGRAASETAAHSTVVGVGEILTGRARRDEPGDRLYRIEERSSD